MVEAVVMESYVYSIHFFGACRLVKLMSRAHESGKRSVNKNRQIVALSATEIIWKHPRFFYYCCMFEIDRETSPLTGRGRMKEFAKKQFVMLLKATLGFVRWRIVAYGLMYTTNTFRSFVSHIFHASYCCCVLVFIVLMNMGRNQKDISYLSRIMGHRFWYCVAPPWARQFTSATDPPQLRCIESMAYCSVNAVDEPNTKVTVRIEALNHAFYPTVSISPISHMCEDNWSTHFLFKNCIYLLHPTTSGFLGRVQLQTTSRCATAALISSCYGRPSHRSHTDGLNRD